MRLLLADLDAATMDMRDLAADVDFSDPSQDELFITADASLYLQITHFLPDSISIPFEVQRALFLQAVVAHDAGVVDLLLGEPAADLASRFLPPAFVHLFPTLPRSVRTATICIATEELGEASLFRGSAARMRTHRAPRCGPPSAPGCAT